LYEELGRGGMGVVYRARQKALDRIVAVKVLLRASFAGPVERRRFTREAQAAARLQHPGIVGIFDIGEEEGVPWFSMEYIAGPNLERTVREFPMEARAAARCLQQIALALQHAHDHGVLHRDLKPSNILMEGDGTPRISDFGIALITRSDGPALTRTDQMVGSPGYAAPEQAFHGEADPRTDVYGLGALLYHLLTTRPPFQGPTVNAILDQLRSSDPLPPRRLNPTIPRDLQTICLKALNKAREERYPSAATMAEDLGRFLAGRPITARPPGLTGKTWRWARRHPGVAALSLIILLLTGAIAMVALGFARQKARMDRRAALLAEARVLREQRLAGSPTAALQALKEAWAISPAPEIRNEAISCLALPEITLLQPLTPAGPDTAPPDPARSSDGCGTARFDGPEIHVVSCQDNKTLARLPGYPAGSLLKLDDHGTRLAIAHPVSGLLTLVSLPDGKVIARCPHPGILASIDWSGHLLATGCENRFIYIWDDQGQLKHRLSGHESTPLMVAFRPATQELASCARDQYLRLWHAARGEEILRRSGGHAHTAVWWSSDGRRLMSPVDPATSGAGGVDIFEVSQPPFALLAPPQEEPHPENLGSAHCSPDGDLAAVMDDHEGRVWDFRTARLAASFPRVRNDWMSALFSPDNASLWFCGWDSELVRIPFHRSSTGLVETAPAIPALAGFGHLLRQISQDGTHLVLSNDSQGQFIVYQPATGKTITVSEPGTLATSIAPDNSWLVTSSYRTQGFHVWSLPDGHLLHSLCPGKTVMHALATPDGKRLIVHIADDSRTFCTSDWQEEPTPPPTSNLAGITTSPNGHRLATISDNEVRLLDSVTFAALGTLTAPPYAGWLGEAHPVFDRDGAHLIVHTAIGSVLRWDLTTLQQQLARLGIPF